MSILDKIIKDKKVEIDRDLGWINEANLEKNNKDNRIPLDFRDALAGESLSIIAEVKKASPSKGLIREDFQPVAIANSYESSGADCISVLTEQKYFQGAPQFLVEIKKEVHIPVLRKDFIVDKRQIRESYNLGADAILLIVSALGKEDLRQLKTIAESFGLSVLVEVHSREELELALDLEFDLIGINNRNLSTFQTSIEHSLQLKPMIPDTVVAVSESGIKTAEDCRALHDNGFHGILVGESLMRKPDPGFALKDLMRLAR